MFRTRLFFLFVSIFLFTATAQAQVTITVDAVSGQIPDADGLLEGDSDSYIRVFVEGNYLGMSPVVNGDNSPNWPGSWSILLALDPQATPTATIEIDVYDQDTNNDEFLGTATYEYDWVNGATVSTAEPLVGPLGPGQIGMRISAVQEPVSERPRSYGELKKRFED